MIAKRIKVIAPLAFLLLAAGGPALAEDDPTIFVESLYETGWEAVASNDAVRESTLTAPFAKAVAGNGRLSEQARVAYDPLVDGRAADVSDVVADVKKETKAVARVHVTFRNAGNDGAVNMMLRKTGDGLRLDNIVLSDGTNVRQDMEKAVKQASKADAGKKAADKAGKKKKTAKKDRKKKTNG